MPAGKRKSTVAPLDPRLAANAQELFEQAQKVVARALYEQVDPDGIVFEIEALEQVLIKIEGEG